MVKPKKTETVDTSHDLTATERVAVLCNNYECQGYRVFEMTKKAIEKNRMDGINIACPICGSNLCYGKIMREPDADAGKVALLKRDVTRLEKENAKIKETAKEDRIRLDTINSTLDKLSQMNGVPGWMYMGGGRIRGY